MTEQEIKKVFENVSTQEMEGLLNHLNAQKAEMEALKGKNNKEMLKFYLDFKAKSNPELAAKYPNNSLGKDIDGCLNYITKQAEKVKLGNCAMIHHSIVFEWAEQFFLDDKIEQPKKPTVTPTKAPISNKKISKTEMQAKIDEWNKEQAEKIKTWNDQHEAELNEWNEKHPLDLFGQRPPFPKEKEENPYVKQTCPYKIEDAAPDTNEAAPSEEPAKAEPTEKTPQEISTENQSEEEDNPSEELFDEEGNEIDENGNII